MQLTNLVQSITLGAYRDVRFNVMSVSNHVTLPLALVGKKNTFAITLYRSFTVLKIFLHFAHWSLFFIVSSCY